MTPYEQYSSIAQESLRVRHGRNHGHIPSSRESHSFATPISLSRVARLRRRRVCGSGGSAEAVLLCGRSDAVVLLLRQRVAAAYLRRRRRECGHESKVCSCRFCSGKRQQSCCGSGGSVTAVLLRQCGHESRVAHRVALDFCICNESILIVGVFDYCSVSL